MGNPFSFDIFAELDKILVATYIGEGMATNGTIKYRVEQLEKRTEGLDTKLDQILQNHLPHLYERLTSIETRMNVLTVINVAAIILALVVQKFF